MSGPTREEVARKELARRIATDVLCDPVRGDGIAEWLAWGEATDLGAAVVRLVESARARHVREAVEGLSEEWIQEYGDVQPFESDCVVLKPEERVRRLADGIAGFRIALLAALTGEGK